MLGTIVRFNEQLGYGFIREDGAPRGAGPNGSDGTIFFHYSDLVSRKSGRVIYVGVDMVLHKRVEFELVVKEGKHRAQTVRFANGG